MFLDTSHPVAAREEWELLKRHCVESEALGPAIGTGQLPQAVQQVTQFINETALDSSGIGSLYFKASKSTSLWWLNMSFLAFWLIVLLKQLQMTILVCGRKSYFQINADSPFEHTVHTFNVLKAYFTHWLVMISLLHLTCNLQTKGKKIFNV